MSDTLQTLNWHLEFECPFRRGESVTSWMAAWNSTSKLRSIDRCIESGDVFGNICVTGVSYSRDRKGPCHGFRIDEVVAAAGDLEAARAVCGRCPANSFSGGNLAGCCGYLPFNPDDGELELALQTAIRVNGLASQVTEAFLKTSPIWYGLWVSSPLSQIQLELLSKIIPELPRGKKELAQFRRACALAIEHDLRLHVTLPPPGHTDLGWITTFPHCPRCKNHSGERWKEYSRETVACSACGFEYVPANTAASEEDTHEFEEISSVLSAEEFAALCAAWSKKHGNDPDPIERMMQEARKELRERAGNQSTPETEKLKRGFIGGLRRLLARMPWRWQ